MERLKQLSAEDLAIVLAGTITILAAMWFLIIAPMRRKRTAIKFLNACLKYAPKQCEVKSVQINALSKRGFKAIDLFLKQENFGQEHFKLLANAIKAEEFIDEGDLVHILTFESWYGFQHQKLAVMPGRVYIAFYPKDGRIETSPHARWQKNKVEYVDIVDIAFEIHVSTKIKETTVA